MKNGEKAEFYPFCRITVDVTVFFCCDTSERRDLKNPDCGACESCEVRDIKHHQAFPLNFACQAEMIEIKTVLFRFLVKSEREKSEMRNLVSLLFMR